MAAFKEHIERGNQLFSKRGSLMTLWQEIEDNFYPEREGFTVSKYLGEEFAAHLNSSYPLLMRRELGNSFSGMLRPRNLEWFMTSVEDEKRLTTEGRRWLEWAQKRQRRVMYQRDSGFVRATREGDHDFAAFGQCVISHEVDWSGRVPRLLYRNWHIRDVAWAERYDGNIGEVHRNWKPTILDLKKKFGGNIHNSLKNKTGKDLHREIKCREVVIPAEEYDGEKHERQPMQPFVRLIIDIENEFLMEAKGQWTLGYTIPRWQTVSGSQYAYSPATVAGLPDARLIQAVTLTLLEAGEMAVRPAMLAVQEAIRSDYNLYPGGITFADADYDERLGDVFRPIAQDKSGLPWGMEFAQDIRGMLATAFFLNKLTLPPAGAKEMTAFETSKRIEEYIREALPLFEPMENDYNGQMCEDTFEIMMRAGWFGAPSTVPKELLGQDVKFLFESPLHDAIERQKGAHFLEAKELLEHAIAMDPTAIVDLDVRTAYRDALHGVSTPSTWLIDQDTANKKAAEMVAQQVEMMNLSRAGNAGVAMQEVGAGAEAIGAEA